MNTGIEGLQGTGGVVTGTPLALLRVEAAAVFVAALVGYWTTGGSLAMFALLILLPDLSMLGFLAGSRVGATVYNMAHFYVWSLLLLLWGLLGHTMVPAHIGLLWAAHIGFDRMIGAGFKYPAGFRYSHLGTLAETKNVLPLAIVQIFTGKRR